MRKGEVVRMGGNDTNGRPLPLYVRIFNFEHREPHTPYEMVEVETLSDHRRCLTLYKQLRPLNKKERGD